MLLKLIAKEFASDSRRFLRERVRPMGMLTGHYHGGYCPICERRTVFVMRIRGCETTIVAFDAAAFRVFVP